MTNDASRLVRSTMTSLEILEFVRNEETPRLTDVAKGLGIGHSTAHNHLATLEEHEWLVREDGGYRLGLKFLEFGRHTRRKVPHFGAVRRLTNELSAQTSFEVEFLVEEYGRIISIFDVIPSNAVYGNVDDEWQGVGISYNMTNTASGKAILANLPPERVDAILERWGFDQKTPYSVTDRETLYDQLETARERGYAKAHQEVHEGFENIAVVVDWPDGSVFGAISIGWPSYIFEDGIDQDVIDQLLEAKGELEAELAAEHGA
jgi:DNA-binding IclR family transcriptional regulator